MTTKAFSRLLSTGAVLVVVAAGCGGSATARSGATTPSSGSAAAGSSGVDPNAPEVVAPGDIPDAQTFVPYTGAGYSFKVPEGWSQSTNGSTTIFTDHYNTVSATASSVAVAPTVGSTRSTDVPALRNRTQSFKLVSVGAVNRPAGPVVVVTYRAASPADPVTGKRVAIDVEAYEFWRDGIQVTLTLSSAHGSDNVDPWKTITDSFGWTR